MSCHGHVMSCMCMCMRVCAYRLCRYNLPWGDFPSVDKYRAMLTEVKSLVSEFKKLDKSMIHEMDKVMTFDIPRLLQAATAQTITSPARPLSPGSLDIMDRKEGGAA